MKAFCLVGALVTCVACEVSTNDDGDEMTIEGAGGSPHDSGGTGGAQDPNGTGGGGDGGDAGSGGSTDSGLVPAFVAQGHLGRLVLSCDDGQSWIADQSNDPTGTCWSGEVEIECDHDEGAGRGITAGNGAFFATFGWGTASTVKRSRDGQVWETILPDTEDDRFGAMAYSGGNLLAIGSSSRLSDDDGDTWGESFATGLVGGNVRRGASVGELIVVVGEAGDVVVSDNHGESFETPDVPDGCGASIQTEGGIAWGNGVLLIVGGDGSACFSTDGGASFSLTNVGGAVSSHLVWSGSDFVAYGGGFSYRSPDGEEWSQTPLSPSVGIGPVAVGATGTFVAIESGWGDSVWYAEQEAYRSEDGIHWETLDETAFSGGHPMRNIAFGYVEASPACPAP